jgi:Holliday junction resolvase RusA-like endonuclease
MIAEFVIYGEPASKANSRRLVSFRGKPRLIKSSKALNYEKIFREQCPSLDEPTEEDVEVTLTIYYASRRPDLDESVILDCMQGFIYRNDRQVKVKHVYWGLDRDNPRAEISVALLD